MSLIGYLVSRIAAKARALGAELTILGLAVSAARST